MIVFGIFWLGLGDWFWLDELTENGEVVEPVCAPFTLGGRNARFTLARAAVVTRWAGWVKRVAAARLATFRRRGGDSVVVEGAFVARAPHHVLFAGALARHHVARVVVGPT